MPPGLRTPVPSATNGAAGHDSDPGVVEEDDESTEAMKLVVDGQDAPLDLCKPTAKLAEVDKADKSAPKNYTYRVNPLAVILRYSDVYTGVSEHTTAAVGGDTNSTSDREKFIVHVGFGNEQLKSFHRQEVTVPAHLTRAMLVVAALSQRHNGTTALTLQGPPSSMAATFTLYDVVGKVLGRGAAAAKSGKTQEFRRLCFDVRRMLLGLGSGVVEEV